MIRPARAPTRRSDEARLLVLDSGGVRHSRLGDLQDHLLPGDLLVVNRSATLPSSFDGILERTAEPLELRLAAFLGPGVSDPTDWMAVTFGAGDWRVPTEDRGAPPPVQAGDSIRLGPPGHACRVRVFPVAGRSHRLLRVGFPEGALPSFAYAHGRPIQYSHLSAALKVWDQQSVFSGPAVSVEPPSAGFHFTWSIAHRLRDAGVRIASVLHSAGLSSTGDPALDRHFPLEEYSEVPGDTARAILETRRTGGRVIALGTTVVRAVESALGSTGEVRARTTDLRLGTERLPAFIDAVVTGIHESGSSHHELLRAFRPRADLVAMNSAAEASGYSNHEYGDLALVWKTEAPATDARENATHPLHGEVMT